MNMAVIDLRSDTVTLPSGGMRRAMAEAQVGDDVYGEDPTVNRLEAAVADILGKEASLFVPSGTMANTICVRLCCERGTEMIVESTSHVFRYENGSAAQISHTQLRQVSGARGILNVEDIEAAIRPDDVHQPPTSAIAIENTHNFGGGSVYPLETIAAIGALARERGIKLHMDGARLFNAAIAGGYEAAEACSCCDTVNLCLSKGLGAPVGSMVVADKEAMGPARRVRKLLGGGMRQAGVIAAAGLYALENNIALLAEDHANAKRLEEIIRGFDELDMTRECVETNIVFFSSRISDAWAREFVKRLKAHGVLLNAVGAARMRAVTNLNVTAGDIDTVGRVFADVILEMGAQDAG